MKKGFTLVELMLVVGLMALMGTIAIGGYSAATRGIADRGALDAAKSIADAAVERARLDRTRTYLYLFDEVTGYDDDIDAGTCQGLMIAVRATGRITAIVNGLYCDEFNLERIEATSEEEEDEAESESEGANAEEKATVTRIYRLAQGVSSSSGYLSVYEGNFTTRITDTIDLDEVTEEQDAPENKQVEWKIYGYKQAGSGGSAAFQIGDLYGKEFAITRLPPNYTFSSNVRMDDVNDLGQKLVNVIEVNPEDRAANLGITIYRRQPNGKFESIGDISQVERKK